MPRLVRILRLSRSMTAPKMIPCQFCMLRPILACGSLTRRMGVSVPPATVVFGRRVVSTSPFSIAMTRGVPTIWHWRRSSSAVGPISCGIRPGMKGLKRSAMRLCRACPVKVTPGSCWWSGFWKAMIGRLRPLRLFFARPCPSWICFRWVSRCSGTSSVGAEWQ